MWTLLFFTECSDGDHGFDCVDRCETCNNTLCERFEGNCTHGCIEGFKGHQYLVSGFWNIVYHCKNLFLQIVIIQIVVIDTHIVWFIKIIITWIISLESNK